MKKFVLDVTNMSSKKLLLVRFLLNPISLKTPNPNSLTSSTPSSTNPPFYIHRCYSATSELNTAISDKNVKFQNAPHAPMTRKTRLYVSPNSISQVIDVIRSSKGGDCRSKLDSMDIRLYRNSVCEIFRVLSCEKVLGLQLFEWIRDNNPELYRSADVCSMIIDNCGWLDDYNTMTVLLERFRQENICLTDKAFSFLPVVDSSKDHSMKSIALVIDILNKVGGSVRNSGIPAMIQMLCEIDSFELAKYVIEITEKKLNYYAILVREKCRRGCSNEAYAMLNEMQVAGCEPDTKLYNYILGALCKSDRVSEAMSLLEEMKEKGIVTDAITVEVIIANLCRLGRMELANEMLTRLLHMGQTPRISTHLSFVKAYFDGGKYDEAYEYVRDVEVKNMPAAHKMYSVLARLHQKEGNIDVAQRIFSEMMEKGLKPDFLYYAKTVNVLRRSGGKESAKDLQNKFSKFKVE